MVQCTTELIPHSPRIAVDHAGSGPLVIFLHGVGGNRTFWHEQMAALAPDFHAVAWDLRGYGGSDDYEGPLDFRDVSADLARVLDYFGATTAHVVGLSVGGIMAMEFYSAYPERVASLTLCDTAAASNLTPEQRAEFLRLRQAPLLEGKEPRDIAATVARSLMTKFSSERVYQVLHDGYVALRKKSLLKTMEAGFNVTQIKWQDVRVPTHVVVGEYDLNSPPSVAREIAEQIEGSVLSIIPEAGHISNVDQPERFSNAIRAFLLKRRDLPARTA